MDMRGLAVRLVLLGSFTIWNLLGAILTLLAIVGLLAFILVVVRGAARLSRERIQQGLVTPRHEVLEYIYFIAQGLLFSAGIGAALLGFVPVAITLFTAEFAWFVADALIRRYTGQHRQRQRAQRTMNQDVE